MKQVITKADLLNPNSSLRKGFLDGIFGIRCISEKNASTLFKALLEIGIIKWSDGEDVNPCHTYYFSCISGFEECSYRIWKNKLEFAMEQTDINKMLLFTPNIDTIINNLNL